MALCTDDALLFSDALVLVCGPLTSELSGEERASGALTCAGALVCWCYPRPALARVLAVGHLFERVPPLACTMGAAGGAESRRW